MVNVPLLRKTMEHIEAHPNEWDQMMWHIPTACGTIACFAGWATILSGAKFDERSPARVLTGKTLTHVQDYAQQLLGLTYEQAHDLFKGTNTMDDLRVMVGELIENAEASLAAQ